MQTECNAERSMFERVEGRSVVAEFDGGALTSDTRAACCWIPTGMGIDKEGTRKSYTRVFRWVASCSLTITATGLARARPLMSTSRGTIIVHFLSITTIPAVRASRSRKPSRGELRPVRRGHGVHPPVSVQRVALAAFVGSPSRGAGSRR